MKFLLLCIIGLYQNWISPYKRFSCAHRIYFGGSPCSVYGKKAVFKHGSVTGSKLVLRRFKACSNAMQRLEEESPQDENPERKRDDDFGKCLVLEGIGEVACCSALAIFS